MAQCERRVPGCPGGGGGGHRVLAAEGVGVGVAQRGGHHLDAHLAGLRRRRPPAPPQYPGLAVTAARCAAASRARATRPAVSTVQLFNSTCKGARDPMTCLLPQRASCWADRHASLTSRQPFFVLFVQQQGMPPINGRHLTSQLEAWRQTPYWTIHTRHTRMLTT